MPMANGIALYSIYIEHLLLSRKGKKRLMISVISITNITCLAKGLHLSWPAHHLKNEHIIHVKVRIYNNSNQETTKN